MLASLSHPHVVPVYDVGVTPSGKHYFSMQLLENGDFSSACNAGGRSRAGAVLSAVAMRAYAHARAMCIVMCRQPTSCSTETTPYLTDFGIARAMALTSRITASACRWAPAIT